MNNDELYGRLWLKIVSKDKDGLAGMRKLAMDDDYVEAYIAYAMFLGILDREEIYEKACKSNNSEALWGYSECLYKNMGRPCIPEGQDGEKYIAILAKSAEYGSRDAMVMLGNFCNRMGLYVEGFYWYLNSYQNNHPDGAISYSMELKKWLSSENKMEYKHLSKYFTQERFLGTVALMNSYNDNSGDKFMEIYSYAQKGNTVLLNFLAELFKRNGQIDNAMQLYEFSAINLNSVGIKGYADCMKDIDENESKMWYEKAVGCNNVDAMMIMGHIEEKLGNVEKAAYYYGLAHTRGDEHAMECLSLLTES